MVFQANDGISLGFILIDSVNLVGVFRAFTKEFFKSFYSYGKLSVAELTSLIPGFLKLKIETRGSCKSHICAIVAKLGEYTFA